MKKLFCVLVLFLTLFYSNASIAMGKKLTEPEVNRLHISIANQKIRIAIDQSILASKEEKLHAHQQREASETLQKLSRTELLALHIQRQEKEVEKTEALLTQKERETAELKRNYHRLRSELLDARQQLAEEQEDNHG